MAGIRVFSAGVAWERAFQEALRFLGEPEGTLLLGPAIGDHAAAWIEERSLGTSPVRFGARVQKWSEWVKALARERALSQKRGFRPLNAAAKREELRRVASELAAQDGFHHLREIWSEERFFAALLDCLGEARLAGLHEGPAIARARELLGRGADAISREAYDDFWALLVLFEARLSAENDPRLDESSLLRLAVEAVPPGRYFLLGFDRLALLEADLLQALAREGELLLPLALPESSIEGVLSGRELAIEHPAALALRGLATNFPGRIELVRGEAPESPFPARRLLSAHSPGEEARAAAALGRAALAGEARELRFVHPPGYFSDSSVAQAFREELGLPEGFQPRPALAHPISRLFFHALELKERDYSLAHGLELAQLLAFTQDRFGDLASRAARAGVRKGLGDWRRKAQGDRELEAFVALLDELHDLIPERGKAVVFASAVEAVAKLVGMGELARRAPTLAAEREAHAALSGILRNAQMLAASTAEVFLFPDWIRELKATLASPLGEPVSTFPVVQLYRFGEWLPPAGREALTVVLGLRSGCEPTRSFDFFLEERARRKLPELLLTTGVQESLAFLDQLRRAGAGESRTLFSWARHDGAGKEREPSWVSVPLGLVKGEWPEVAPERPSGSFEPVEEVRVPPPELGSYSPSLLESYKECPFKAFAEKVLRLEDKVQEASLDLSRLDEGSVVHKALELFYGPHKGKGVIDASARERLLDECLEEAVRLQRVEYFKGSEELLAAQLRRLRALLLGFLEADAANYARFPFFGEPELEREVSGSLGGKFAWKGKADRIDLDPEARKLVVLDYKIGATTPKSGEIEALQRFQLPLYMDAAEALHPGFEAAGALYASVATGERGQGLVRKDFNAGKKELKPGERKYFGFGGTSGALHGEEEFTALRARSREEALRLAERIAAGEFPVRPLEEEESCKRCSVRPACRIRELRSPPREEFPRLGPAALLPLLEEPAAATGEARKARGFNPEQSDALARRGGLVFIEASAGTGKTTVIVERIRRFLAERMAGEPGHLAVERFAAISFTEKSAQELGSRVAAALLEDAGLGAALAAQAQQRIGTIHGFCRRVISDFPVEAGVSPLAAMLDQKGAEALGAETLEELFLFPGEEAGPALEAALREFPRARVEEMLLRLQADRSLLEEELRELREGGTSGKVFPEGAAREALLGLLSLAERFSALYEARKRERNVLDFQDLEALALKVLASEHARAHYRERLELLLVDEFQDTNSVQRSILEAVARPGWANLFVVGDAKQSIYRFRAADVSVFQGLRRRAEEEGSLVTLSRNYRSRAEIVEAANRVTAAVLPASGEEAPDFEAVNAPAVAELPAGGKVRLVEYGAAGEKLLADESRALEARLVARIVAEARARVVPPGGRPPTIALLLRKIAGNEAYLRALAEAGIPFRVGASRGFYGQSVITDAIALLRVLYGEKNDMALLALLRSPWVAMSDAALLALNGRGDPRAPLWDKLLPEEAPLVFEWKRLALHSSVAECLERAYRRYPMGRRELLQSAKLLALVEGLEAEARPRLEILDCLSRWSGWERESEGSDEAPMPEPGGGGVVQVMTVHAAKGLEFDITLLADLTGRLRSDNSPLRVVRGAGLVLKLESEDKSTAYTEIGRRNQERELAELKRLFYVALTRAKQEQYLLLPRAFAAADKAKWASCGHFLRAADLSGVAELVDGDSLLSAPERPARPVPVPAAAWPAPPSFERLRESSITELAALQFCPEFHRLKFVQGWDDRIVALWEKPRLKRPKKAAKEADEVSRLLKELKIERKERGIALHRVLERVRHHEESLESAELWLREAYEAQGVDPAQEGLERLIAHDRALLAGFLSSPLGRELFSREVEAHPEVPFAWRLEGLTLHGAMDRLVRRPNGSWVVVDYKSSVLEESLERYSFQVRSYLAAVDEFGKGASPVEGYLVDLHRASSLPVRYERDDAMHHLREEIRRARESYTLADPKTTFVERGVRAGDHCFSCPYAAHCDLGREVVLQFS